MAMTQTNWILNSMNIRYGRTCTILWWGLATAAVIQSLWCWFVDDVLGASRLGQPQHKFLTNCIQSI